MEVSLKELLARLEFLKKQKAEFESTVHAYDGAIQEVEHWLRVLDKK